MKKTEIFETATKWLDYTFLGDFWIFTALGVFWRFKVFPAPVPLTLYRFPPIRTNLLTFPWLLLPFFMTLAACPNCLTWNFLTGLETLSLTSFPFFCSRLQVNFSRVLWLLTAFLLKGEGINFCWDLAMLKILLPPRERFREGLILGLEFLTDSIVFLTALKMLVFLSKLLPIPRVYPWGVFLLSGFFRVWTLFNFTKGLAWFPVLTDWRDSDPMWSLAWGSFCTGSFRLQTFLFRNFFWLDLSFWDESEIFFWLVWGFWAWVAPFLPTVDWIRPTLELLNLRSWFFLSLLYFGDDILWALWTDLLSSRCWFWLSWCCTFTEMPKWSSFLSPWEVLFSFNVSWLRIWLFPVSALSLIIFDVSEVRLWGFLLGDFWKSSTGFWRLGSVTGLCWPLFHFSDCSKTTVSAWHCEPSSQCFSLSWACTAFWLDFGACHVKFLFGAFVTADLKTEPWCWNIVCVCWKEGKAFKLVAGFCGTGTPASKFGEKFQKIVDKQGEVTRPQRTLLNSEKETLNNEKSS